MPDGFPAYGADVLADATVPAPDIYELFRLVLVECAAARFSHANKTGRDVSAQALAVTSIIVPALHLFYFRHECPLTGMMPVPLLSVHHQRHQRYPEITTRPTAPGTIINT